MELGDLWVKVANNLRLTSQEQEFLRLEGRNTQQRNTQVAGIVDADGSLSVNTLKTNILYVGKNVFAGAGLFLFQDGQMIPSGASTKVTPYLTQYYTDDFTVSNGEIIVPQTGSYSIAANVFWSAAATGIRKVDLIGVLQNGRDYRDVMSSGTATLLIVGEWALSAGNAVYLNVYQDSGGDIAAYVNISLRRVR
jgi:hypothetical protein